MDTPVQDGKPRRQAKNRPSDAVLGRLGDHPPHVVPDGNLSKMSKSPEIGSENGFGKPISTLDTGVQYTSKNVHDIPEIAAMAERLEKGWQWFERNPNHPNFAQREGRWIEWLREYERACDEAYGR